MKTQILMAVSVITLSGCGKYGFHGDSSNGNSGPTTTSDTPNGPTTENQPPVTPPGTCGESGCTTSIPVTNTRVCSAHRPEAGVYSGSAAFRAKNPQFVIANLPSQFKESDTSTIESALADPASIVGNVPKSGSFSTGHDRFSSLEPGLFYFSQIPTDKLSRLTASSGSGKQLTALVISRDSSGKPQVIGQAQKQNTQNGFVFKMQSKLYTLTRPDLGGCQGNEGSVCQNDCENHVDPLIVNLQPGPVGLDGLTSASSGVKFDIFGIGFPVSISWIKATSNYAFLIRDDDGDGKIPSDGEEMFAKADPNGFEELIKLNNGGRFLTGDNPVFSQLKLWTDPAPGKGELVDFASLAAAIDLNYTLSGETDRSGNVILGTTSITLKDGSSRGLADVLFSTH